MKIRLLFIITLPLIFGFAHSTVPDWTEDPTAAFQSSLLEARHHSDKTDRPYMIIFQADWCSPCQWMDKFTFNDARVQQSLLHNYSAVKMDIDEFEGFALKEQYQVKLLPTILFFNRNNEIIGRYENTYDVDDFLKILNTHKNFGAQQATMAKSSSSPATISVNKTSPQHASARPSTSRPVTSSTSARVTTSTAIPTQAEFTIQIAAFNNYQNAEDMTNKMRSNPAIDQSIRVRQLDHLKYPYRVTVGEYHTHEEAASALMHLDNHGIKGLLKRVQQFGS